MLDSADYPAVQVAVLSLLTASGILKGFDPLNNLVLDGTTEYLRGISETQHFFDNFSQHILGGIAELFIVLSVVATSVHKICM